MSKNKNIKILSQDEINELYLTPEFSDDHRHYYFQLNDFEKSLIPQKSKPEHKILFILLLGYFKYQPVILDIDLKVSEADIEFISNQEFSGRTLKINSISPQAKSRLYKEVLKATKTTPFESKFDVVERIVRESAKTDIDRRALFRTALDAIEDNRSLIPKYYLLQKIVSDAQTYELKRIINILKNTLNGKTLSVIRSCMHDPSSGVFMTNLKKGVKTIEAKDFSSEIEAFNIIDPVYIDIKNTVHTLRISKANIDYFSSRVNHYTVTKLKNINFDKAAIYLLCFLFIRYQKIIDRFAQALIQWVRRIHENAVKYGKEEMFKELKILKKYLAKYAETVYYYADKDSRTWSFEEQRTHVVTNLVPEESLIPLGKFMESLGTDMRPKYWEYISNVASNKISGIIRKLFLSLDYVNATKNETLAIQVESLKSELLEFGQCKTIDVRNVYVHNRPYMYDNKNNLIPVRAEFAVYRRVIDRIDECSWYIENGDEYKPLEDDLINLIRWKEEKESILASGPDSMRRDIRDLLAEKIGLLKKGMKVVEKAVKDKETESVVLTYSDGEYSWTVKNTGKQDIANDKFFEALPTIHLTEVVRYVSNSTGFLKVMKGANSGKDASEDLGKAMAVLFQYGMHLGLYRMADSSPYTYDELKTFRANYFRLETINEAIDTINNAAFDLSIFNHYNLRKDVLHGSIDGRKLRTQRKTMKARHSKKYFKKGVGLSNISAALNHLVFYSKLTETSNHESYFAYDAILNTDSNVKPDVLSSDTHGTNKLNFALLDLEGIVHAPRYAQLGKVIDSLFKVVPKGDSWTIKLKKRINEQQIFEGWDYSQRTFMSIRQREISQFSMIRKLSRTANSDKTLASLTEYDRLIKAIYILEIMEDMDLRRYIQNVLNRGEAYHQLMKAIEESNGPGGIVGNNDQEMEEAVACTRLIASCIIYFNCVLLSLILDYKKAQRDMDTVEHLKRVSPVAWRFIDMTGDFPLGDAPLINIEELFKLLVGD